MATWPQVLMVWFVVSWRFKRTRATCEVDAISVNGKQVFASKGAYFGVVEPEEVTYDNDLPAGLKNMGTLEGLAKLSKLDGVTETVATPTKLLYCGAANKKFKCCWHMTDANKCTTTNYPQQLVAKGFDNINGMTVTETNDLYVAKNKIGFMGYVNATDTFEPKDKPWPLSAQMVKEGFDTFDGFTKDGNSLIFLKGDKMFIVDYTKDTEGKIHQVPSTIVDRKYTPIEGLSFKNGVVTVAKGGKMLEVKGGAVITKKTPFPPILTENGFTKISGLFKTDNVDEWCVTQGNQYMCWKGQVVSTSKRQLPQAVQDQGFSSPNAVGWDHKEKRVCVTQGMDMMCQDGPKIKLSDLKDGDNANQKNSNFFHSDLTGIGIDVEGYLWVVKKGYFGQFDLGTKKMMTGKTLLPGLIKDVLCGGGGTTGAGGATGGAGGTKETSGISIDTTHLAVAFLATVVATIINSVNWMQ